MFCIITLSRTVRYCIVPYCTAWDITLLLHCIYGALRYSTNPHNSNYAVLHCPVVHQLGPAKPRTADAFCKQQSNVFSQSHQAVWNHDGSASDERLPGGSGRDWVLTDVNRVRGCSLAKSITRDKGTGVNQFMKRDSVQVARMDDNFFSFSLRLLLMVFLRRR